MLDRISNQLEKYMDLVATRQRLVAANIANADTPAIARKTSRSRWNFKPLRKGKSRE
jgi:flagellar basal-body rod protein FlgB